MSDEEKREERRAEEKRKESERGNKNKDSRYPGGISEAQQESSGKSGILEQPLEYLRVTERGLEFRNISELRKDNAAEYGEKKKKRMAREGILRNRRYLNNEKSSTRIWKHVRNSVVKRVPVNQDTKSEFNYHQVSLINGTITASQYMLWVWRHSIN